MKYHAVLKFSTNRQLDFEHNPVVVDMIDSLKKRHRLEFEFSFERFDYIKPTSPFGKGVQTYTLLHARRELTHQQSAFALSQILQGEGLLLLYCNGVSSFEFFVFDE